VVKRVLLLALALLPGPAVASEIPGIDIPYATYRQRMFANGFKPRPGEPQCGPYPETCTGNRLGTAYWIHPVDGHKVDLMLWPCKHGWCLAPPVMPPPAAGQ